MLAGAAGWEVRARQTGSRTPGQMVAGVGGLIGLGPAVSPVSQPAIAVLPLENLGAGNDGEDFVDGLTDEIIRNLAAIEGLQVRSRTSSFTFKDRPRNVREVGAQLGVNLILEGSVLREGDRLRVNAQLVRVADDVPLWADKFDREKKDIFAIQEEISRAIVNRLRLTLGGGRRRYEVNLQAYDLYLQARAFVERAGAADGTRAAALLEQVVAIDPAFAPAHAALADAYATMSRSIDSMPFDDGTGRMREAARRALELDPLLAEAHAATGLLRAREVDWQGAVASFERAVELNPGLTRIYTTYVLSTLVPLGRLAEAERYLETALRNDPLSLDARRHHAMLQIVQGRHDEAIETLEAIQRVDPAFPYVELALGRALAFAGRLEEAVALWEPRKHDPGRQHWIAYSYVRSGRRAEVEGFAARHEHPYRLAILHAALGNHDQALDALDRAADVMPDRVALLLAYPEMAPLRGDPRFAAVRRKLGLP